MDRYTKSFIVASLVYFVLAALMGLWMGLAAAPGWARFAHVHFNLLGFMAMMIYGVGYFVIPRFNARPLRWPSWVPVHFYASNIGLLGMVLTYPELPSIGFGIFSALSVGSAAMFGVNLIATIVAPEEEEAVEPPPVKAPQAQAPKAEPVGAPAPAIHGDVRVGEILTRWPHLGQVFAENGFPSLGDPEHQEQVKQLPVTLRMACQRHGVDLDAMIALLTEAAGAAGKAPPAERPIGPADVLGDILQKYPATEAVFRKYYGSGCFTCPGQATESVKQSAMMHNVDMAALLDELNRAARS